MQKNRESFQTISKKKLIDYLEKIKKNSGQQYLALVLDNHSEILIIQTFHQMELQLLGIKVVSKLSKQSPSFNFEAIYLINLNNFSMEIIQCDLKKKKKKYLLGHILSLNEISEEYTKILNNREDFAVGQIWQLNYDFIPWIDNAFSLGMDGYFEKRDNWITETAKKLVTLLISFDSFFQFEIYYQNKSKALVDQIQKQLDKKIKKLIDFKYPGYEFDAPKIKVIIFQRQNDYQSPLVSNFNYLPLIFQFNSIENLQIKQIKKNEKHQQVYMLKTDLDPILDKLKYLNLIEATDFMENASKNLIEQVSKQDIEFHLKQIDRKRKKLKLHQKLLDQVFKKTDDNFKRIASLQQTIVNGINEVGEKLKDSKLLKIIIAYFKQNIQTNQYFYARLLALLYLSIQLDKQESNMLQEPIEKRFSGLYDKIMSLQKQPKKLEQKKQGQDRLDLFRHQPVIVSILKDFYNEDLKFQKINIKNEEKANKLKLRKKIGRQSIQKVILFSTGYLGVNQIVELNKIQRKRQQMLLIGSNKIVSQNEYLSEIQTIQVDNSVKNAPKGNWFTRLFK